MQRRLRADGYDAAVAREPFAGEDDDEDHPWAVSSDAPEVTVELLVEEYDGWLEHDTDPPRRPAYHPSTCPTPHGGTTVRTL